MFSNGSICSNYVFTLGLFPLFSRMIHVKLPEIRANGPGAKVNLGRNKLGQTNFRANRPIFLPKPGIVYMFIYHPSQNKTTISDSHLLFLSANSF